MPALRTALVALVTIGALATATGARAQKAAVPPCVKWWSQVVAAGAGYNHVVGIENGCDKPVACVVSTDVAPDPIQATVAAGQRAELVTFRGSPASTFKPRVICAFP